MNEMIKKEGSFNSRVIALEEAIKAGDARTASTLIDEFKLKRDFYNSVTVTSLQQEVDDVIEAYSRKDLSVEEKEAYSDRIADLREKIVEKKAFMKNSELVNEICDGEYYHLLPEQTKRVKRNRKLITVAAIATGVILIALGAKGCKKDKNYDNSVQTTPTSVVTVVEENGDTVELDESETTSFFETVGTDYDIDPVIGEPTSGNGYINGGTNGTTGTNGGNGTNGTTGASETTVIVNDDGTTTVIVNNPNVVSDYVAPSETTIIAPIVNTTPSGTDPLPIEPSTIVQPDNGIDDRDPVIIITDPTTAPTAPVPTGDIEGQTIVTYPTEVNPTIPTDAPHTDPTTAPTSEPTQPTLPPLDPSHIIEDEEDIITYTFDDKTAVRSRINLFNNFKEDLYESIVSYNNDKGEIVDFVVPTSVAKTMRLGR